MGYLHEKLGFVLRLILLASLLAAQGLSFAHELDHSGSGDANLCAVCSISSGLDAPVSIGHVAPDSAPTTTGITSRPDMTNIASVQTPLSARGPPASS